MKKWTLTKILSLMFLLCLLLGVCVACTDKNQEYYGIYKDENTTIEITKDYVSVNGEKSNYTLEGDTLSIEGYTGDLHFYENKKVLSFDVIVEFDSGSITERNKNFNANLWNWDTGYGGIGEAYTFDSNGKITYINTKNTMQNASGIYRIKNGVIQIFTVSVLGKEHTMYWYISEQGELHFTGVYIKDLDTYFDNESNSSGNNNGNTDNENNSSGNNNGNADNENSSTQTPTYTLNYSVNNAAYGYITGNTTQTVDENEDGTGVTAVANDGYKFANWSDGVSTATRQDMNVFANVNVTANFEPIKLYKFTLYDEGIISSIDIQENSIITLDNLTKQGYTFDGWSINGQLKQAGETITIIYNTTAYARWTIDTYDITYHLGDGVLENEKTSFTINDLPYKLPTPIPEGELSFVKWTTDEAGENEIKTITELGDYTLYAHYEDSTKFLTYKYSENLQGYEVTDYTGNGKSVKIPSIYKGVEVKSIAENAFGSCSSLTSVVIPDGVTSIGSQAFRACSSLTSVTIPDGVTSIRVRAFYYCSSLTSVKIPNSVTSIGYEAFSGCSRLTSVVIPDGVTSIDSYAFRACSSLTSVTIGNGVTSIDSYAFYYCSSLTSVVIGNGVRSIKDGAFKDCSSLTSIEIPDSVTSIGNEAFSGCRSLTSVVIPDSVTSIGSYAFGSCSNLKTWFIHSSVVANSDVIGDIISAATDVYVRADITVTASIYNVLYNNLGKETLDGVEYYHYQIKGE